jgi:hypothetical protein
MVDGIMPATARVETVNVAVLEPAGTVTPDGTLTGSPPDNETKTSAAGALLIVTVPTTGAPPMTLAALSVNAVSTGAPVTVSMGDWPVPLNDPVKTAVPAATAVTVKVALDAPARTVIGDDTVATAVLLLESETLAPPVAAADVSVIVPCIVVPVAMLDAFRVTADIAAPAAVGCVVEPPQ